MTEEQDGARRVTRDVAPETLADLRDHPPRASVAFVAGDAVELLPAQARFGGGYAFAVEGGAPDLAQREVVLVIDDGPYWFQLRGLSIRGLALPIAADVGDGRRWYAIDSRRVLAWNYGEIRAE